MFVVDEVFFFWKEFNMMDFFDEVLKLMMLFILKWEDKLFWFYDLNEVYGSFVVLFEVQKKVDELIKGKKIEMERIVVLIYWVVDNICYVGIIMGEGEGFMFYNMKMNYIDCCGVCKDIVGMLIFFLCMVGFEVYLVMMMVGSCIESIFVDYFNYCVVVVKLVNGMYMFFDFIWVFFCCELWSSVEQQQNYLFGILGGFDLCLILVLVFENYYVCIIVDNKIDVKGMLKGLFIIIVEGQLDSSICCIFMQGWQIEW